MGIRPSGVTFGRLRQLLLKEGRDDVIKFLNEKMNLLLNEPLCDWQVRLITTADSRSFWTCLVMRDWLKIHCCKVVIEVETSGLLRFRYMRDVTLKRLTQTAYPLAYNTNSVSKQSKFIKQLQYYVPGSYVRLSNKLKTFCLFKFVIGVKLMYS